MATAAVIFVDDVKIKGKFSVTASVDRAQNPPVLSVNGLIETPTRLPDKFDKLEGGRAVVHNVLINSESFGSEDDNIVYEFVARNYDILDLGYKKKG